MCSGSEKFETRKINTAANNVYLILRNKTIYLFILHPFPKKKKKMYVEYRDMKIYKRNE